jgi:hypothetical protein
MKRILIMAAVAHLISTPTYGQVQDCSAALVRATTQSTHQEITDLAIAWSISENVYNEEKAKAGVNAVIKGIPMGANYNQFRQNVRQRAESLGITNFEQRSAAYASSGLINLVLMLTRRA